MTEVCSKYLKKDMRHAVEQFASHWREMRDA